MRTTAGAAAYPPGNRDGNGGSLPERLPSIKDLLKSVTGLGTLHFVELLPCTRYHNRAWFISLWLKTRLGQEETAGSLYNGLTCGDSVS